jgi:hypothetical protein
VTADSRDHPAMQDQLSATVQAAQRGLAPAADSVKSRVRDFAGQQKAAGAAQIGGIAGALEAAANDLQDQAPKAVEYVHDLASKIDAAASSLRELSRFLKRSSSIGAQQMPNRSAPETWRQSVCGGLVEERSGARRNTCEYVPSRFARSTP